jgi:hypothetical protein
VTLGPIPDDVAKLVDFVPKKRYLELYGESAAAVDNRVARKHWVLGVHYTRPPGGGMWISLKAVNAWAQGPSQLPNLGGEKAAE